eukprot:2732066-Amphidinium_carterae.1
MDPAKPDAAYPEDIEDLRKLLEAHKDLTHSSLAAELLQDWPARASEFTRVFPKEFKQAVIVGKAEGRTVLSKLSDYMPTDSGKAKFARMRTRSDVAKQLAATQKSGHMFHQHANCLQADYVRQAPPQTHAPFPQQVSHNHYKDPAGEKPEQSVQRVCWRLHLGKKVCSKQKRQGKRPKKVEDVALVATTTRGFVELDRADLPKRTVEDRVGDFKEILATKDCWQTHHENGSRLTNCQHHCQAMLPT